MRVLHDIIQKRQKGLAAGIPSYCTAGVPAISALMRYYAKRPGLPVLIEATANQVNQYGGYTGMKPADYRAMIEGLAKETGLDPARILLGGDHLGPLTWQDHPEAEAMAKAEELVRLFTAAGFKKIHLDTSMRLGDDDKTRPLPAEVCARRGARLFKACAEVLHEQGIPQDAWPEFIIGSEVPVPGGVSGVIDTLEVTSPADFAHTVEVYRRAFEEIGESSAFNHVCAVVVQPGVEYSDHNAAVYNRDKAKSLMQALKAEPDLMFEGHSTDYQPAEALREMVEDGVGILKVGPMITFYYREALYALAEMEKWIYPEAERSHLIEVCERVMTEDPSSWKKYYSGSPAEQYLARHFSYSDRIRYYLPRPDIQEAVSHLMCNMRSAEIPQTLAAQYMPLEAAAGITKADALIDAHVARVAELYESACNPEASAKQA